MSKKDGGMAFPMYDAGGQDARMFEGMTLRAFLASQAQAAWIQALALRRGEPGYSDDGAAAEAARLADISADAMINELERE
jgi:hypothetical protein